MTYTEFLMATIDLKQMSKTQLWTVFKHLDTDNTGYITYQGLVKAFRRSSKPDCENQALEIMSELNMSKTDKLSFD